MSAEQASLEKGWSRRKYWTVLGVIFGLQLAWLFLFGRPDPAPLDDLPHRTSFRMVAGNLPAGAFDTLLVSDPTLFVLPSRSSFSGAAWMSIKEMDYSPAEWTEPPSWFNLRPEKLITAFNEFVEARRTPLMQVSEKKAPYEPAPTAGPATSNLKSRLKIDGEIASRIPSESPVLNSWHGPEPLDRSVVEVGVNDAGQVVSMRLIQRSGLAAADQAALKLAGTLQFSPATSGGNLMLGTINCMWHTEPMPLTNSTPVAGEAR